LAAQICCDAQIGYGPRFSEFLRQWARLAAKILRGAKRADVPIEQPTHFELVINLQTARAIGLFPHGARIARRQHNRMMDFLLGCINPQLAHRVISRQRSISVAFGAKRT